MVTNEIVEITPEKSTRIVFRGNIEITTGIAQAAIGMLNQKHHCSYKMNSPKLVAVRSLTRQLPFCTRTPPVIGPMQ